MKIKTPRDSILEVARSVFSRFGFSKTTMSDIAEAARKGRRTIYSYFESKEDIYQAVIQKEIDILQGTLSIVVKENLSPREKLEKYLRIRMKTINELVNYYDAIKNAYHANFMMIEKIRRKFDNDEVGMISRILNEGKERNIFNVEDSELTAKTMVLALKGLEIPIYFGSRNILMKNPVENLLNILFNGILRNR